MDVQRVLRFLGFPWPRIGDQAYALEELITSSSASQIRAMNILMGLLLMLISIHGAGGSVGRSDAAEAPA